MSPALYYLCKTRMHIIQLLISMPVKLIEGNYINYLFVAGVHEKSWLVSTTFKL